MHFTKAPTGKTPVEGGCQAFRPEQFCFFLSFNHVSAHIPAQHPSVDRVLFVLAFHHSCDEVRRDQSSSILLELRIKIDRTSRLPSHGACLLGQIFFRVLRRRHFYFHDFSRATRQIPAPQHLCQWEFVSPRPRNHAATERSL